MRELLGASFVVSCSIPEVPLNHDPKKRMRLCTACRFGLADINAMKEHIGVWLDICLCFPASALFLIFHLLFHFNRFEGRLFVSPVALPLLSAILSSILEIGCVLVERDFDLRVCLQSFRRFLLSFERSSSCRFEQASRR